MAVITLTTDWQTNDYYVGAMKGKILSLLPTCTIADISHQIKAFNISHGVFVLRNCFHFFPQHSVHLFAICTELSEIQTYIAFEYQQHFFVGADNGFVGLLCNEKPNLIIKINNNLFENNYDNSFPELNTFSKLATEIAKTQTINQLGEQVHTFKRLIPYEPAIDERQIIGKIIYIDSYKNAISNIELNLFQRVGKGRKFIIYVQSNRDKIKQINKTYNQSAEGELLAIFNSVGYLEIAMRNGQVSTLLNLDTNSSIRVDFID